MDHAPLAHRLRIYRRRAAAVLFVRTLAITSVVAALTIEATARLCGDAAFVPAVEVAIALTMLASVGIVLLRMPALTTIARTLDARLRLHDRTVTALQFETHADPFSSLVIRDALSALDGVPVSRAFPFECPRAAYVLAIVAATAPLGRWVVQPRVAQDALDQGVSLTAAAAAESGRQSTANGGPGALSPHIPRPDIASRAAGREVTPDPHARPDARAARAATSQTDAAHSVSTDGRPDGAAHVGSSSSASAARGGAQGERTNDRHGSDVRFDDPQYTKVYRRAVPTAEAAADRDPVSPERREYVRKYFLAIRPRNNR